ncbi:MAG: carbamoyltransferase HypF [Desulfobacteraceae bacterium]|nr:carbamoyltransferase HypF [Desulfobacteraceae bacterium]
MRQLQAQRIRINGIVQGVGFRPFVYRLAHELDVRGEVSNTASGVTILAEATAAALSAFRRRLESDLPPLARITEISVGRESRRGFTHFRIVESDAGNGRDTLISPDVSVCDACLREMTDPADRRFGYPFINCTNCGPRYTIIEDVPYDRPYTSMRRFAMCPRCQQEYDDPLDRRFHAQPNACPDCGPQVSLRDAGGAPVGSVDPVADAARRLRAGEIVAVKGLGGFHLCTDAENEEAVRRLRKRKHREEKPLALMSADLAGIRRYAHCDADEERLLLSPRRPIVLLAMKNPNPIAASVSPRNRFFGVMLPYTPLHHLLLGHPFTALVMTSGNLSEEPICIDNDEAVRRLGPIADCFLVHDRDIVLRSDDSIVRRSAGHTRFIRRSRGYVPVPVFLKRDTPAVLACGAELKNTVCLTKGDRAFVSQHIGDLENLETLQFLEQTVRHLERILDIRPEAVAHDLHPDYLSTRYALERNDLPRFAVQHHHAHIVSCMAENRIDGPVIGLALDGTGYGPDGTVWGGEVLVADAAGFTRAGHLAPVAMPGSAAAIREPWRMAGSYLHDAFGGGFAAVDLPFWEGLDRDKLPVLRKMIERGLNSPLTSSLGRLFDGVAALVGLRSRVRFEGQAAMELEMIADPAETGAYPHQWEKIEGVYQVPTAPIVRAVVADLQNGVSAAVISSRFHRGLVRLFSDLCRQIAVDTGLDRVALSGGVFQNDTLLSALVRKLESEGLAVYTHRHLPANDGGISLGQAVVAAARLHAG